jgi:guanyl-specific ribonuclease Sa
MTPRPSSARRPRRLWGAALILVGAIVLNAALRLAPEPATDGPAPPAASTTTQAGASTLPAFLPAEARDTIALIQRGGPFPHPQDGQVFGNRERLLPARERGWYREYTVATPGLRHRGERRIVTGGRPPAEWWYTDDHYASFRAFDAPAPGAGR